MLNDIEVEIYEQAYEKSRVLGHSKTRATRAANEAVGRYRMGSGAGSDNKCSCYRAHRV